MATEKEPIRITNLPSATVTTDGDYLVFSTSSATYKIKVSDFMIQFTQAIYDGISTEETARKSADNNLSSLLAAESTTRQKDDATLSDSISKETSQRLLNVTSLENNINALKGVAVLVGDGETKVFTVNHNLSTKDLIVQAYLISGQDLSFSLKRDLNSFEITFDEAPEEDVRVVYMAVMTWNVAELPFDLPFEN